mgnify:CR=1 FL=1
MWKFEPSAALAVLEGWEKRYGLDIRRNERLDRGRGGVTVEKGRITAIRMLSGNVFRGKMFVDATYEGDLMASAGISYAVGREANSVYGETINGVQAGWHPADFPKEWDNQIHVAVDPYVVPGDRASGLIRGIEQEGREVPNGSGDRRIQAYCFRVCMTNCPENRILFKSPAGYDERDYELLFRMAEAGEDLGIVNFAPMPNRKTDSNNRGGFSLDFIGGNWNYPEASYEERECIVREHLRYQQGLLWTLANHPRIPAAVREFYYLGGTIHVKSGGGSIWATGDTTVQYADTLWLSSALTSEDDETELLFMTSKTNFTAVVSWDLSGFAGVLRVSSKKDGNGLPMGTRLALRSSLPGSVVLEAGSTLALGSTAAPVSVKNLTLAPDSALEVAVADDGQVVCVVEPPDNVKDGDTFPILTVTDEAASDLADKNLLAFVRSDTLKGLHFAMTVAPRGNGDGTTTLMATVKRNGLMLLVR